MRDEYDFTDSRQNPYAERLRKPVTMNLDVETVDYFKAEAKRTGIPYPKHHQPVPAPVRRRGQAPDLRVRPATSGPGQQGHAATRARRARATRGAAGTCRWRGFSYCLRPRFRTTINRPIAGPRRRFSTSARSTSGSA